MENLHDAANKNDEAERICMSVVNQTPTWPEQSQPYNNPPILQPQNNYLPISPYTHYYPQYLSQFAPNFVPYYYSLLTRPINYNYSYSQPSTVMNDMNIEKYINYELSKQQSLMRKQNPPARPALAPLQLPISRKMPLRKPPQEKRILNVQVVAMATNPRDKKPSVEPLPPVEAAFKERVAKINKSQQHYIHLFGRLSTMLQTLNRRYDGHEEDPEPEPEDEYEDAPPPPLKRPRHDESSCSSSESQLDVENAPTALSHYPQHIQLDGGSSAYLLGPNGTQINAREYGQIFWTSAPVATRCLLGVVFTSDELATHTLTGKPSPAFYGRERPAKKMLDQGRVDDIVVSVRNRTGGKERHIRATITTKCADTAKKYKRRAKKALSDNMMVKDE